jgi:uncharacterized membrane protein
MKRIAILMVSLSYIVLILVISQLQSCKHDPATLNNLPIVCFDTQVQPILGTCVQCHSGSSKGGGGGFNPSSYTTIMKSVKPGDPWGSKLYTIVSDPNNPNMMPPKGHQPLSQEQRTLIEVWILQGAKDTKCNTTAAAGVTNN